MKIKKLEAKDLNKINGTFYFYKSILTTKNVLIKLFGRPYYESYLYNGNSQNKWCLTTDNDISFTIYDYLNFDQIKDDDMIEWHIGTHNQSASNIIHEQINSMIN